MAPVFRPPFSSRYQLRQQISPIDFVSEGQAALSEDEEMPSLATVHDFLQRELDTPILNELYPHLSLVAKKAGDHIDPLHRQFIQRRNIVIAEDPALHLVWYYDTLYLKPIPQCLYNYAFWEEYLLLSTSKSPGSPQNSGACSNSHICRTALGYLRSYSFLIWHESDYLIAQRADLIPKDISYQEFKRFILPFRSIPDEYVSPRYHFGHFRLTRLNYAVRLLRPSTMGGTIFAYYHGRYWQTGDYLRRFGTPLLFFFAAFSVVLSAMQVILAALGQDTWPPFVRVSWGFSVAVIILIVGLAISSILGVLGLLVTQAQFALRMRRKERITTTRMPSV